MRARRATPADVEAICRICAEGWRDSSVGLPAGAEIEQVIATSYTPTRVARELAADPPAWGGWWVAEDDAGTFGRRFAIRFAPLTLLVAVIVGTAVGLLFFWGWK